MQNNKLFTSSISTDQADREPDDDKEGSTDDNADIPTHCSVTVKLTVSSAQKVNGGNFAMYKIPSEQGRPITNYKVTVVQSQSGSIVTNKNFSSASSGWQVTDVSEYAKTLGKGTLVVKLSIFVERDDGEELTCPEIKRILALDCSVQQQVNNFPSTENILPGFILYLNTDVSSIFDRFQSRFGRNIAMKQESNKHTVKGANNCHLVSLPIKIQNYFNEHKVLHPQTADIGACIPQFTKSGRNRRTSRSKCTPKEFKDLHVVVQREDEPHSSIKVLRQAIITKCN